MSLGHEIRSSTDQQTRREILKLNADQGRLGGLLKMLILDDDENRGKAERLLDDIRRLQSRLLQKVRTI